MGSNWCHGQDPSSTRITSEWNGPKPYFYMSLWWRMGPHHWRRIEPFKFYQIIWFSTFLVQSPVCLFCVVFIYIIFFDPRSPISRDSQQRARCHAALYSQVSPWNWFYSFPQSYYYPTRFLKNTTISLWYCLLPQVAAGFIVRYVFLLFLFCSLLTNMSRPRGFI